MALAMCSCATYSYMGNITLLTNDGNIVEKWDNATINNNIKTDSFGYSNTTVVNVTVNNGIDFFTENGERIYANGGIIIVRNIEKIIHQTPQSNEPNSETLTAQYNATAKELDDLKAKIKLYDKNSPEYQHIKTQMVEVKKRLNKIETELWQINGDSNYQ